MSQPCSANLGAGESESHDPDSSQVRQNNPESTDSDASRSKEEPPSTTSGQIVSPGTNIEELGDDHEIPKDDARNDGDLSEGLCLTPLHKLLQGIEDGDDGPGELENRLGQWKNIIDVRSRENQETALHMAVRKGFNKMARQLLTAGAGINIENGSGKLPLHLACEDGDRELVEMLLEKGADPERADASGIYPLHSAVIRSFGATVIRDLLGPRGSVINKTVGGANWTPLNKAIFWECENVVDTLLEGGASLRIRDSDGWTPLMTAIKGDLYDTVHKLLNHLREHSTEQDVINMPDNNGMTPLMQLSAKNPRESITHIEHLLQMKPDADITDDAEKTALHHAMASLAYWMEAETGPYKNVVLKLIHFLPVKSLLHLDKDGETAFDVAFDEGEKSPKPAFKPLLDSLVDRLVEGESIEEPLCRAVYRLGRHPIALSLFQKKFAAKEIRKDLKHEQWAIVEWAIYARLPRVLLTYLRTLGLEKTVSIANIDKSIKEGRRLIKNIKWKEQQASNPSAGRKREREKRGPTSRAEPSKDAQVLIDMEDILDYLYPEKVEKPVRPLELSKPVEGMESSLKHFRAAIIQSNFVRFRTIREVLYDDDSMKQMQDIVERLKQFEYTPNVSSEQASQTSEEENTKPKAQFTWIHLPSTNMVWMQDTAKKILKGEGCGRSEAEKVTSFLRSSWIEIPDRTSTSRFMRPRYVVKKVDHVTKQDAEDENELKEPSERRSSQTDIRSRHNKEREKSSSEDFPGEERGVSFEEIGSTPERDLEEEPNSHAHVSRAVQAVVTDHSQAEKSKSFAVSAIYMPYLYFSTYHQSEEGGGQVAGAEHPLDLPDHEKKAQDEIRMRQKLFEAYQFSVIHQPTTLDEFYYQFATDHDSVRDKNLRNRDQVVTKYLQGQDKTQTCWPLLRVSQLWIWTIDEKWLITSTSCATNNTGGNLVTDILGHLQRQVENGSRRSGPTSTTEMSKVIVDYCIGTYDRKRRSQNANRNKARRFQTGGTATQGQHQENMDKVDQSTTEDKKERSIHQIFSDSINEISREESNLFSLSYRRRNHAGEPETNPDTDHTSEMEGLKDALEKVANQLCHIKDIRDELNILKSIATFQHKVQSAMAKFQRKSQPAVARSGADEDLSSDYILRDIGELDKFAEQTQEAVKTTLTLQESDIANWQANESMKQGKIVLVFTLVTVWFLPLSFLTSLFALDVASFMEAPAWAFYVIFFVPLVFLGSAVAYVWKGDTIKEYSVRACTTAKRSMKKAEGKSTALFRATKSARKRHRMADVEDV